MVLASLALLIIAEVPSLAIVPVVPAGDGSVQAIVDAVIDAARGRPIRAFVAEDVVIEEMRSCGADEACMASRFSTMHADVGVIALVDSGVEPPFIAVRMIDVRAHRVRAQAIGPLASTEATIADAVRTRVANLLDENGYQKDRVLDAPPLAAKEAPHPAVFDSPWFWAMVGVLVAGGVTAAVIATSNGRDECVCIGPPSQCPPC